MPQTAYISVDELDAFQFHDARLESIRVEGSDLVWDVADLNVIQGTSQNPDGPDQCVDALIRFDTGYISELVFPSYRQSTNGVKNVTVPEKKVPPRQFGDILKTLLFGPCFIMELEEVVKTADGYSARFLVDGSAPDWLLITLRFRSVTVTWDRFEGPAWYVNWP